MALFEAPRSPTPTTTRWTNRAEMVGEPMAQPCSGSSGSREKMKMEVMGRRPDRADGVTF